MGEIAGVVSELEKHGYSSEEIFKAIDLTGTTDTKALMNSMICKLKSSASMYDYSIVLELLFFQSIVRATFYSKIYILASRGEVSGRAEDTSKQNVWLEVSPFPRPVFGYNKDGMTLFRENIQKSTIKMKYTYNQFN